MSILHHLGLSKLVFSRSAYQRQHDPYTLCGSTGFLLRAPAQLSALLGLRQEFAAGLLAHVQGSKQIETAIHTLRWRQGTARPESIDDGLDTRQGSITQEPGSEIDPPHKSPAIDPLLAGMPALDTGGIQELLPLVVALPGEFLETEPGSRKIPSQAHDPDHQLSRALHPGKPCLLEEIRQEEDPQYR